MKADHGQRGSGGVHRHQPDRRHWQFRRDHQLGRRPDLTFPSATASVTQPGGVGTTFEVVGSHVYQQAGSYAVTVTVNDLGGALNW